MTARKHYNSDGEEIFSPEDQKALEEIRKKLHSAEVRLDIHNDIVMTSQTRISQLKAHIAFLQRQEKSFYKK
jgi:chaperonin cofactor prefoldin